MQQLISCPQQLRLETYSIAMHWAYHIRTSKANTFMNKIDLLKRISLATDTWPQVQASSVREQLRKVLLLPVVQELHDLHQTSKLIILQNLSDRSYMQDSSVMSPRATGNKSDPSTTLR